MIISTQCTQDYGISITKISLLQATVGNPGAVPLRGANMVSGVPRSQGPPPPYHQTTRSASVPIAIQSPNPSSPNNPTSNLSLPSPRASSALNSPADCNRQFQLGNQRTSHLPGQSPTSQDSPNPVGTGTVSTTRLNHSNPGTPVSHSHIAALSPSGTNAQKDTSLDFPTNQQPNGKWIKTVKDWYRLVRIRSRGMFRFFFFFFFFCINLLLCAKFNVFVSFI